MSDKSSRLPNLYHLLGLQPLEAERAKIVAALDAVRHRIANEVAMPQPTPEESAHLQKLVALGEKVLLEPQRKVAYDQEWKSAYASPAASCSNTPVATVPHVSASRVTAPRWDTGRLVELLPKGDPHATFDMAAFLRSAESRDPAAAEADIQTLIGLLDGDATAANSTASAPSFPMQPGLIEALPIDGQPSSPRSPLPRRGGSQALGGHPQRMRKKKQRSLIVGGLSFASALGGLVLLRIYLSRPTTIENHAQAPVAISGTKPVLKSSSPVESSMPSDARRIAVKSAVVGSGLPQPGTTTALDIQAQPLDSSAARMSAMTEAPAMSDMPAKSDASSSSPSTATAMAPTPTTNPTTGATTPDTASPSTSSTEPSPATTPATTANPATVTTPPTGTAPETSAPEPVAPAPADVTLTRDEKQFWLTGMVTAKASIAKFEFEQADKQLAQLEQAAKTGLQRAQLERLQQIAGFEKEIRQAMVDAIESFDAAEEFKIGSTIASFVEGDDSKIIVRVTGERRSFALPDVPVAMGLALVDRKPDVPHADMLARKGAYILLHPKNKAMLQRGKQMLQEAAAAGAISMELARFYEDDYALSQSSN